MRAAKGEGSLFKTPNGYRGYVTVGGKRKYFSAKTKAEAGQKRRELLTRRDDGKLVAGRTPTVGQWATHWLENVAKHTPKTYAMNKWVIESKVMPELGGIRLSALTLEHVEEWVQGLGVSPSSQRRYLAPLTTALNLAVERGKLGFNPAERVKFGPQKRKRATTYSREDRDAILAAATGRNGVRWHIALRLGIRPAEACALAWPDFDEDAGTITVRRQILRATGFGLYIQDAPKTEAGERTFKLPKSLATMLREHRAAQLTEIAVLGGERVAWEHDGKPIALMFTQLNGRPISPELDATNWKRLLAAAGLPPDRRYRARHTAGSHMIIESGGDVAVTAKVLGHSDPAFTYRTYVHPLAEREDALMDAMDAPSAPYAAPYDGGVQRSAADQEATEPA